MLRTRLQTATHTNSQKYTGIVQTAKSITKEQGLGGFYRGFHISMLRTVPSSILTIYTFEFISKLLRDNYSDDD